MDRHRVAAAVRGMLLAGGALVHVHATTHQGVDSDIELPHPRSPREAISRLVQRYLGPQRRAGQGVLAAGTPGDEDGVYRATGFTGPQRLEVPGQVVERTTDQIAASVYFAVRVGTPLVRRPPGGLRRGPPATARRREHRRPLQRANAVHRPGRLALTATLTVP